MTFIVVFNTFASRIGQMPIAGDVIGVVGGSAPRVAVAADLTVAVQVVEQHIFFRQLVVIRGDLFTEHDQ